MSDEVLEFGPDCYRLEGCAVANGCKIYCRRPYDNMRTLPYVDRILSQEEIAAAIAVLAGDVPPKDHQ